MKSVSRPWWALSMQLPLLDTQITQQATPSGKKFTITGTPVLRGFHWIIYGPLAGVILAVLVAALAWTMEVRGAETGTKIGAACLIGAAPLIGWGIGGWLAGKIIEPILAKVAQENVQTAIIAIDLEKQIIQLNQEATIPIESIRQWMLVTPTGAQHLPGATTGAAVSLVVETDSGHIVLLPQSLGTSGQKQQLLTQLRAAIE